MTLRKCDLPPENLRFGLTNNILIYDDAHGEIKRFATCEDQYAAEQLLICVGVARIISQCGLKCKLIQCENQEISDVSGK